MGQPDINRIIEMAWEDKTPFEAITYGTCYSGGSCIHIAHSFVKSEVRDVGRSFNKMTETKQIAHLNTAEQYLNSLLDPKTVLLLII